MELELLKNFTITRLHVKLNLSEEEFQQNIESLWQKLKRRHKTEFGTAETTFESYMDEFVWKQQFGGDDSIIGSSNRPSTGQANSSSKRTNRTHEVDPNKPDEPEIITKTKEIKTLIYKGYSHSCNKDYENETKYWLCSKRRSKNCNASITSKEENGEIKIIGETKHDNHDPGNEINDIPKIETKTVTTKTLKYKDFIYYKNIRVNKDGTRSWRCSMNNKRNHKCNNYVKTKGEYENGKIQIVEDKGHEHNSTMVEGIQGTSGTSHNQAGEGSRHQHSHKQKQTTGIDYVPQLHGYPQQGQRFDLNIPYSDQWGSSYDPNAEDEW
uniref:FLYWCH-type domain-containing protein n=1 Tax=Meloidogyne hapla TaxID=6305 RepID=A0A1I8BZI8_MELHA